MLALASASLVALAAVANAQDIKFDSEHNATTIIGSWASGSKNVTTGSVRHCPNLSPSRYHIDCLRIFQTMGAGWATGI